MRLKDAGARCRDLRREVLGGRRVAVDDGDVDEEGRVGSVLLARHWAQEDIAAGGGVLVPVFVLVATLRQA